MRYAINLIHLISSINIRILIILLFCSPAISAVDFNGRIDTRYQFRFGDWSVDNDLLQYHFFDVRLSEAFSIEWYGVLKKDLDKKIEDVYVLQGDPKEYSDVAFRGLPDAANSEYQVEYRIFSAFFQNKSKIYGVQLGRNYLSTYGFNTFDGAQVWMNPFPWLRMEALGGKPWHYAYYIANTPYYDSKEFIAGGGFDFMFKEISLYGHLKYLNLHEKTDVTYLIGDPAQTTISNDHFIKADLSFKPDLRFQTDLQTSIMNEQARNFNFSLRGFLQRQMLTYRLEYFRQLVGIQDLGNSLNQYSLFLGASQPFHRMNAVINQSLTKFFNLSGPVQSMEVEISYAYRAPIDASDKNAYNPSFQSIRGGFIFANQQMYYLHLFFDYLFYASEKNDMLASGGEIGRNWQKMKLSLGTAFFVQKYDYEYSTTQIKDSFYAREYYLNFEYSFTKQWKIICKASLEQAEMSSLTSTTTVNPGLQQDSRTELISDPRNYVTFDIRAAYTF